MAMALELSSTAFAKLTLTVEYIRQGYVLYRNGWSNIMQGSKVRLDEVKDGSVLLYNGPNRDLYFGRHTVMKDRRGLYIYTIPMSLGKSEKLYLFTQVDNDGVLPGFYWFNVRT